MLWSFGFSLLSWGIFHRFPIKWWVIFLKSLIQTSYFSNSTCSFVTSSRFSPFIDVVTLPDIVWARYRIYQFTFKQGPNTTIDMGLTLVWVIFVVIVRWMGLKWLSFLNQTLKFYGYVWGSTKRHKDTCLKEIGLRLQILITTPTLSSHTYLGGPMYLVKKLTNMYLW